MPILPEANQDKTSDTQEFRVRLKFLGEEWKDSQERRVSVAGSGKSRARTASVGLRGFARQPCQSQLTGNP